MDTAGILLMLALALVLTARAERARPGWRRRTAAAPPEAVTPMPRVPVHPAADDCDQDTDTDTDQNGD